MANSADGLPLYLCSDNDPLFQYDRRLPMKTRQRDDIVQVKLSQASPEDQLLATVRYSVCGLRV